MQYTIKIFEDAELNDTKTYIDIFSGCGGLSLGLQNAGWNCLFSVEKNEDAFETYRYNLIDENKKTWPDWLELSNHDINEIIAIHGKELISLQGKIDLIAGGPPCQGFSTAGKRKSNDYRNELVKSYINFIKLVKPRTIMFENVVGFTYSFKDSEKKIKHYSQYIVDSLISEGYNVHFEIINMAFFGIPQQRKRFILVGMLNKDPSKVFDNLRENKDEFLENKDLTDNPSVEDAIGDLVKSNGTSESPDKKNFDAGKYGPALSKYQKYMRSGADTSVVADSHRFTNHRENVLEINRNLLKKAPKGIRIEPDNIYVKGLKKRGLTILNPANPAPTITSIPDELLHYSEPRILTVRENARLQSFPDRFQFKGKYTSGGDYRKKDVPRYTQVANAVPPLFAEQIGIAIKKVLDDASE